VTEYRASVITAPNSAYDLCASKIADRDLASLDLSSVRAALCGAEPILATTLRRFSERFAGSGFGANGFLPVYGLAEATLAVTVTSRGDGPRIERFDRKALETHGNAVRSVGTEATGLDAASVDLVGVGRPRGPADLRIVDEQGRELPECQVGSIEVGGPSLMSGYFGNPAATEAALRDGFVRTGDLGFVSNGELFVVGRSKEMIIKGGRNVYPYDIEAAVSAVAGVRAGRVVAFGVRNADIGTEDLTVVCETKLPTGQHKELERAIKAAVFQATALRIDRLHLVGAGVLLKTSSGKLRRNAVRESLENGTLQRVRVPWSLRVRTVLAARFPWLIPSREEPRE
jgi:acyl-CoA synthetase (AMP-forming)/AMP-acid ligase II